MIPDTVFVYLETDIGENVLAGASVDPYRSGSIRLSPYGEIADVYVFFVHN